MKAPRWLTSQQDRHTIIYNDPHLGGEGMEMMALHTKVCGAALF
ncbi:hypothetical protein [Alloprevotella tannerae]|nr:hypothetical protein [Alloprevotella tannerae]